MNYTTTVKALRRSAAGAEFITASQLKECLNCGNSTAEKILRGLDHIKFGGDRATKRYDIEDVARRLIENKIAG